MTWLIVVAIVVVVAVVVAVALQRRSAVLRQRFGPEYDRMVEEEGDRRRAEAQLRDRARRHDELTLRALSPEARDRYAETWQAVQAGFVDDPDTTVGRADALVQQVMRDRGYPVDDWDQRFEMVSVDHPELAEDYRVAHAIHERRTGDGGDAVDLDDMREAFQRYRSLFSELLEDGREVTDADGGDDSDEDAEHVAADDDRDVVEPDDDRDVVQPDDDRDVVEPDESGIPHGERRR